MRWYDYFERSINHFMCTEQEHIVKGYFLTKLGVDISSIPDYLNDECKSFDISNMKFGEYKIEKVYVKDIIGTKHSDYIMSEGVLRGKYLRMLKKPIIVWNNSYTQYYNKRTSVDPVRLSRTTKGELFVDGNGNHRVTFYKMM